MRGVMTVSYSSSGEIPSEALCQGRTAAGMPNQSQLFLRALQASAVEDEQLYIAAADAR